MEPYRTTQPDAGEMLPVTEQLVEQTIVLPTGTDVSREDVASISSIICCAVKHAAEVREVLGT